MVFQSCVFEWPHHICSVFNALYNTCDCFATLIEVCFQSFPRIYTGISDVFPKEKKNRITVSIFRLVRPLGSFSGLVLELKRILSSRRWNSAWIELMPQTFSLVHVYQHFLEEKIVNNHYVKTKFNISHFLGRIY